MPIDASIYSLANKPTAQLEMPMDIMAKGLQLKNMQNQNALGGMDVQQKQMALQDQQKLSQLMQTGKYNMADPNSVKQLSSDLGAAGGSANAVMALNKQSIDQQKNVAEIAMNLGKAAASGGQAVKDKQALINQQAQEAASLALTAKNPDDWQNGLANLDQKYAAAGVPSLAQKYGEFIPQNVNALKTNGMTYAQAYEQAYGKTQNGPNGMNQVYPPSAPGGMPTVTQIPGTSAGTIHPAIGPNGQPTFISVDKTGNVTPVAGGYKPVPAAALTLAGMGGMPGAGVGGMGTGGQAMSLDQVPPQYQSIVKAIGEYRMDPSKVLNRNNKAQVMQMVASAYPNYGQGDAKANMDFMNGLASEKAGTPGGTILSTERMSGHAAELVDLTKKLDNSNGLLGHLGDVAAGAVGYSQAMNPTVGQWNFVHGKLEAEAQKLVTGGVPGSQELMHDINNMKFTDPPAKQLGIIQSIVDVGLQNTMGVKSHRDNILGPNSPGDSMLSEKALQNISKVYAAAGKPMPDLGAPANGRGYTKTAQASNSANGSSPAPSAAVPVVNLPVFNSPNDPGFQSLPPGAQFKGADGIVRVKHG